MPIPTHTRYAKQVQEEARAEERGTEMRGANPKYILRNWMAAQVIHHTGF